MIGCFPPFYDDEMIFNTFARYQDRMQYPNEMAAAQELMGREFPVIIADLPYNLEYLARHLPPEYSYTADRLISEHTLQPFHAPFLPLERQNRLLEDMYGSSGYGLRARAGMLGRGAPIPENLRYCPACVELDRNQLGETYWHRIHQAQGVEICAIHNFWIESSEVKIRNGHSKYTLISAEKAIKKLKARRIDPSDPCYDILRRIFYDARWLLQQQTIRVNAEDLRMRYLNALIEKGLAQLSGEVRRQQLVNVIRDYYPPELLELLGCNLTESIYNQWFVRMLRKPIRAHSPIYHLLMMQLLGYTAEAFFQLPVEYLPFGKGPWPCLNQTCHHYKQLYVEKCEIKSSQATTAQGHPVGIFSCVCGFAYSRRGPDTTYEDRFRYDRVEAFGPVWNAALEKLIVDSNSTMAAAARALGVDDKVVKNHVVSLGLLSKTTSDTSMHATISDFPKNKFPPSRRHERRAEWLKILEANPSLSRTELRDRFQAVYQWLRTHDKDWLEDNRPPIKERTHYPSFVEWASRDDQLAKQVRESASRLRDLPGKPVRINKAEIARDLGNIRIFGKALKKLPLTVQALEEVFEARHDFTVRRIWWVAQCLVDENMPTTRSEIYSRAGVAGMLGVPQVKAALEDAFQMVLSQISR